MSTLKITSRRQITLRKEFRAHLGVGPGDTVEIDVLDGGRIMIHARTSGKIVETFGMLSQKDGPSLSIEEMNGITGEGWSR
ncbi:MAG: transcriptional regulator [Hirschia sp.]|nr:transcriptional regulator [Hirschia sp.]MBF16890.1 transcriptional regulator [Hirschia sp.]|tara:strand:+ start:406 stop:648 length:243 start_codon:yes stop_codon:yes gene_type:complete